MKKYVSMLRGINVSGQKKIKMTELVALYQALELSQVKTYIQSGNVVFTSKKDDAALRQLIQQKIADSLGLSVSVIMRSAAELQRAIQDNPFSGPAYLDNTKLHVTFLVDKPAPAALRALDPAVSATDELRVSGREVYVYCPGGYGNTKLSNAYLEKKLGVTATTRNWKTVNTLYQMAKELDAGP